MTNSTAKASDGTAKAPSGGRAWRLLSGPQGTPTEIGGHENAGRGRGVPGAADRELIAASLSRHWDLRKPVMLAGRDPGREADLLAQRLVDQANTALDLLREDGPSAALRQQQVIALESVLMVRGRPSLRVRGRSIESIDDTRHPGSTNWRVILNDYESTLARQAAAVAAIMVKDTYSAAPAMVVGTAWLIRRDLAITNRHVLLPDTGWRIARRLPGEPTRARIKSDVSVNLDFAYEHGTAGPLSYAIDDVAYITQDRDPIDVALLRVCPMDTGLLTLPQPITIVKNGEWDQDQVWVIGHPGRMAAVSPEVAAVFGDPDGRKRVSFGELMDPDDNSQHDLIYDSSTIGGFSGGAVGSIGSRDGDILGLHYLGGDTTTGNRAIKASALRDHPLWDMLY